MHGELAFTHYTAVRIGGQKPTGTLLVQSPSLIDHGRHGMAMFLELSSYILAPLLMMSHVSCKVFAWQGPGKWMHCLMRPLIDHIRKPTPRGRARSSRGSGSGIMPRALLQRRRTEERA